MVELPLRHPQLFKSIGIKPPRGGEYCWDFIAVGNIAVDSDKGFARRSKLISPSFRPLVLNFFSNTHSLSSHVRSTRNW